MKILLALCKAALWTVLSLTGIITVIKFISFFIADISSGKDIFIPGVLALFLGALLLTVFAFTRVLKYIRIIKNANENA